MKKENNVDVYTTDEIKKDINNLSKEEMELYEKFEKILKEQQNRK